MKTKQYLLLSALILLLAACNDSFLEVRPDKALLVPTTIKDFDALMEDLNTFNSMPGLQLLASDDLYITTAGWNALNLPQQKNAYTWADDVYEGQSIADWNTPYQQIFYCNIVLDGLAAASAAQSEKDRVRGTALFHRGFAFYNLAQMFARQYSPATAASDLGIPLRLSSNVNLRVPRATLRQTYEQILNDITEAESLLPLTSIYRTRPNKRAALALLARIYLSMGDYEKALTYANSCLAINNVLVNYSTLSATAARPFTVAPAASNDEIIFYAGLISYSFNSSTQTMPEPSLYQSYVANDLRRTIYFVDKGAGMINYKGSYSGSSQPFGGLANDELYLIRAECHARKNEVGPALAALNDLLLKRWKPNTYVPLTLTDASAVLKLVLDERRKELVSRGLRWSDLRRLNQDPATAVALSHTIGNTVYTLQPNSPRYVFPIPDNEMAGGNIEQNPR